MPAMDALYRRNTLTATVLPIATTNSEHHANHLRHSVPSQLLATHGLSETAWLSLILGTFQCTGHPHPALVLVNHGKSYPGSFTNLPAKPS